MTIGVLDGVHRGHRALIAGLDGGMMKTVLTFEPHPVEVLRPGTNPRLITTIEERLELLRGAGVDQTGVLDLAEIKELPPEAFVEEVLVDRLGMGQIVVGPDFRFGKDRTGDITLLQALGGRHGFAVEVIELVTHEEDVVSSSGIRAMIEKGLLADAERAMGSRFMLGNEVIAGEERGRDIGFPTANLAPPPRKVIPAMGVYAAYASVAGEVYQAAVNVGVRPTFGKGELVVEAYLLDFDADLYGQHLTLEFVALLRPELKFDSVSELVERMRADVRESRALLGATRSSMS